MPSQDNVQVGLGETAITSVTDSAQRERISQTPGICGGEARIQGTRISVWTLEVARRDGCSDNGILAMYPSLEKADLSAAWEWVKLHHAQIESAIHENED